MIQNPNLNCAKPLSIKGNTFTAGANTVTNNDFTTPTNRGQIIGVEILLGNNTIADLAAGTISLSVAGITVLETMSLLKFGSMFENSRLPIMFLKPLDEGVTIQTSVTTATGNTIVVAENFLFYNPYNQ